MKVNRKHLREALRRLLIESIQVKALDPLEREDMLRFRPLGDAMLRLQANANASADPGGSSFVEGQSGDIGQIDDPFFSLLVRLAPGTLISKFASEGINPSLYTGRTPHARASAIAQSNLQMQLDKVLNMPAFRITSPERIRIIYDNLGTGTTPGIFGEALTADLVNQQSFVSHMARFNWPGYERPTCVNLNDPESVLRIPPSQFPAVDVIVCSKTFKATLRGSNYNETTRNLNFNQLYSISSKGALNPAAATGSSTTHNHTFNDESMREIAAFLLANWLVSEGYSDRRYKLGGQKDELIQRAFNDAWDYGVRSVTYQSAGLNLSLVPYMRTSQVQPDDPVIIAAHATEIGEVTVQLSNPTGGAATGTAMRTGRGPTSQIRTDPRDAPAAVIQPPRSGARRTGLPTPEFFNTTGEFRGSRRGNLSTDVGTTSDPLVAVNAPVAILVAGTFKEAAEGGAVIHRVFGQAAERDLTALRNIVDENARAYALLYTEFNRFESLTSSSTGLETELKNLKKQGPIIKTLLTQVVEFTDAMMSAEDIVGKQEDDKISPTKRDKITRSFNRMMTILTAQFKKTDEEFRNPTRQMEEVFNMLSAMAQEYNNIKAYMSSEDLASIPDPNFRLQTGMGVGVVRPDQLRRFQSSDTGPEAEALLPASIPLGQVSSGQMVPARHPTVGASRFQISLGLYMNQARDIYNGILDALRMILELFDVKEDLNMASVKANKFIQRLGRIKRLTELKGPSPFGPGHKTTVNHNLFELLLFTGCFSIFANSFQVIVEHLQDQLEFVKAAVKSQSLNNSNIDSDIADDFGGAKTKELVTTESRIYKNILKALLKQTK